MAKKANLDTILKNIADGKIEPVYLVSGDLVAAEPQAKRIAEAVAERSGCAVESHKRPNRLHPLFADLKTVAMFTSAKVVLLVDTALLADSKDAAELIDQAAEGLPVADPDAELSGASREAASRLIQALHVFGMSVDGEAAEIIESLPKWAVQGGRAFRKKKPRGRNAKDQKALKEGLVDLLEAGRRSGLVGFAEGDLAELGELVTEEKMPAGHCLVLAEPSVAAEHPVVAHLKSRGAALAVATVSAGKGGQWQGLGDLVAELERETGVPIAPDALNELAKRTLRGTGDFRDKSAASNSTARFGGEYRKLAGLVRDGKRIDRALVQQNIKDRGEEDVWQILDAVGNGRGGEAVSRYYRLIESAADPMAARLSFFSLLTSFCRQLSAVAGVARIARVQPGVQNYNQFKSRWAPALQGDLPVGGKNPLAGLHPYRLHKAYLAASQIRREELPLLPWRALETELRIKGDTSDADAAVTALITHLVASRI